jgi:hypothetical protein
MDSRSQSMIWSDSMSAAGKQIVALCLATASAACASPSPEEVVRTFHEHAAAARWDDAFALFDLHAKGSRFLGARYDSGPPEEQARTREILGRRIRENTESFLKTVFRDGPGTFRTNALSEARAEVIQTRGDFSLIYTLERQPSGWRIVDRTHERQGIRPQVDMLVRSVLEQIRNRVGREPTLADVNDHLYEVMTHTRQRAFRVGGARHGQ